MWTNILTNHIYVGQSLEGLKLTNHLYVGQSIVSNGDK